MNFAKIASFLMILMICIACNPVDAARMENRRLAKIAKMAKMAKLLIHRRKYANKLFFPFPLKILSSEVNLFRSLFE